MECLGPECAERILAWLRSRGESPGVAAAPDPVRPLSRQETLFRNVPYQEESPAIRSLAELEGAFEHLEYGVFRRTRNQLTRAERLRLDNTLDNALFKAERFIARLGETEGPPAAARLEEIRRGIIEDRERQERQRQNARRADLKLKELATLTPETFEEFVAEVFEALDYRVDRVGGSGDEGADLRLNKGGLRAVVQCKYSKGSAVVGSPDLQKFLGTVHHTASHKGFFVTTRTFSLAAERFAAEHPIELIDGPRLVELVQVALGPAARRDPEPAWF